MKLFSPFSRIIVIRGGNNDGNELVDGKMSLQIRNFCVIINSGYLEFSFIKKKKRKEGEGKRYLPQVR